MTLHTKFEKIGLVVCKMYISENCTISFFFFAPIKNNNFEPTFSWIDFCQIQYTNKAHCAWASYALLKKI